MFSCTARQRARTPHGFTLIELLVVIAIIAILAAILFPVFAKVREKAYQNTCVQHQRQLAIGILTFTQDNEETLPLPSAWVEATNLADDAKVFNCPTSSRDGVPSDPDYGMNAFLYDLDFTSNPAARVGLAIGKIDNPASVEMTADLKKMTNKTSGNEIQDECINPFPRTFSVTGFGSNGSGEARHNGSAVVSFIDGHVATIRPGSLGASGSGYNLPQGAGRIFIDFGWSGLTQNAINARMRLAFKGVTGDPTAVPPIPNGTGSGPWGYGCTLNPDGTATMTDLCTDGSGWSPEAAYKIVIPGNPAWCHWRVQGTLAGGSKMCIGANNGDNYQPAPSSDPNLSMQTYDQVAVVDTVLNKLRVGMTECWSTQGYNGYTTSTWIPLANSAKGVEKPIPAGTTKVDLDISYSRHSGNLVPWPTGTALGDGYKYWTFSGSSNRLIASYVYQNASVRLVAGSSLVSVVAPYCHAQYVAGNGPTGMHFWAGSINATSFFYEAL